MNIQPGAIAHWLKQTAGTTGLVSLGVLLLATPIFLTAQPAREAPQSITATIHPMIPTIAYTAVTEPVRVEILLSRRQAILYRGNTPLKRYPVGIGKPGWETPTGSFRVVQKKRNPAWISPFSNEKISSKDPRNPLGGYWIGFWKAGKNWIGFHGTLDPGTIGRSASHGCIHMRPSDLKDLFAQVSLGTPVKVVR